MAKLILVEAIFLGIIAALSLSGTISLTRAGQVLIGIAIINFVFAMLTFFGWPVLRGDVSDFAPMSRQDSLEGRWERNSSKYHRPSNSLILGLLAMGVVALGAGIALAFLAP